MRPTRRGVIGLIAVAILAPTTVTLTGCAGANTTVRVLVAARAIQGDTIASLRQRAFQVVTFKGETNTGAKVGWITWQEITGDIVILNEDHTIVADEMITTEGNVGLDEVYDAAERPEDWVLNEGDTIAFFSLDCDTIAVANGGETLGSLLGNNDPSQVVVLRAGKVVELVDFDSDVAMEGDELVIFGGKIAA
jgi:hypothetical protein